MLAESLSVAQIKKAVKKHLADGAERTSASLFRAVKDKKTGSEAYRLNPAVIAPKSMTGDERGRMAAELRRLLAFVELNE